MALSPRDRGEVRALIDDAIGELTHGGGAGSELTKDEQLVELQARVHNLDAENRLLRLAIQVQRMRSAIERIAEEVGVSVDLDAEQAD